MIPSKKKYAIFVIGPPGSGKSTISKYLKREFLLKRISVGEILRKLVNQKVGSDSVLAKRSLESGLGASDDLILKIYEIHLKTNKKGFVFDGNPGGKNQLFRTLKLFRESDIETIFCIKLTCSKKICIERIMTRKTKRQDNNKLIIDKRFVWYNTKVLEAYKQLKLEAKSTIIIDAKNSIQQIQKLLRARLTSLL